MIKVEELEPGELYLAENIIMHDKFYAFENNEVVMFSEEYRRNNFQNYLYQDFKLPFLTVYLGIVDCNHAEKNILYRFLIEGSIVYDHQPDIESFCKCLTKK